MSGAFLVLALAVTPMARVAVPAIETDASMEEVGTRLREHLSRQLQNSGCVALIAEGEEGSGLRGDVQECGGAPDCRDLPSLAADVDWLLKGALTKTDGTYHFQSSLLDAGGTADDIELPEVVSRSMVNLSLHLRSVSQAVCEQLGEGEHPSDSDLIAADAVTEEDLVIGDLAELDDLFQLPDVLDPFGKAAADDGDVAETAQGRDGDEVEDDEVIAGPALAAQKPPTDGDSEEEAPSSDVDVRANTYLRPVEPASNASPNFLQRRPLAFAALGAGAVTAIVGASLGAMSQSIWSENLSVVRDGVVHNSISRADARRANAMAVGANVLFGVAGVCAIGGTVLFFVPIEGGVAAGGQF